MIVTRSSISREIAFLVSHTIHHNAIVAQMLEARGRNVATRFGLAPATPDSRTPAGAMVCAR
jgi:hypothetical protein